MRQLMLFAIVAIVALVLSGWVAVTQVNAQGGWRTILISLIAGIALIPLGIACLNAVQTRAAQGHLVSSLGFNLLGLTLLAMATVALLYVFAALALLLTGRL